MDENTRLLIVVIDTPKVRDADGRLTCLTSYQERFTVATVDKNGKSGEMVGLIRLGFGVDGR